MAYPLEIADLKLPAGFRVIELAELAMVQKSQSGMAETCRRRHGTCPWFGYLVMACSGAWITHGNRAGKSSFAISIQILQKPSLKKLMKT